MPNATRRSLAALGGASLVLSLATPPATARQPEPTPLALPAGVPSAPEQWGASFGGDKRFTEPRRDAQMGFTLSTQVLEVLVKAGERVTEGQLLVRGDDREEASRYEQQTHRAESMLQIERARAAAELAQKEYEQSLESFRSGGDSQITLDRSRLAMETAQIDVRIAEWSQQQEQYLAELTQARVDRFHLVAPFDGVIDAVNVDMGDVVRETDPVVRVVDLSELWINVPVLPETVLRHAIEADSPAWVLIRRGSRPIVARGSVVHVSPTTDSMSGKYTVRVSIENGAGLPSGLEAWVRFSEPSDAWLEVLAMCEAEAAERVAAEPHMAWPFQPGTTDQAEPSQEDRLPFS
ncbi:MAG: efflux RND transporter periplasmic adaptor subunit, partial [Phycisphaerales bacterium]|nr:efflux RND transporter periplasmic adaptor subunit [Phycisphaerales bacterium]